MARELDNATSQHLYAAAVPISAYPFTQAIWFNPNTVGPTVTESAIGFFTGSSPTIRYRIVVDDGAVRTQAHNGSTNGTAISTASASAGSWNHACGVFTSNTSRTTYLNGGNSATNTTNVSLAGSINNTALGVWNSSMPSQYFDGLLAEAAVWDVALTPGEVAILAAGFSPLFVRPQSLVAYWPLIGRTSPEICLPDATYKLTVAGATPAAHPRMVYPGSAQLAGLAGARWPRWLRTHHLPGLGIWHPRAG